jgi:type II secretory ATPase GspE/PulE/Tfp pilus assembly ATPase PilB-like protein
MIDSDSGYSKASPYYTPRLTEMCEYCKRKRESDEVELLEYSLATDLEETPIRKGVICEYCKHNSNIILV